MTELRERNGETPNETSKKDLSEEEKNVFSVEDKPVVADTYTSKAKEIEALTEVDPSQSKPPKNFVYKEGGWGWVVVIATSYCFGILVGMMNNYALIYNKLEIVYNGTENHVFYAGNFD